MSKQAGLGFLDWKVNSTIMTSDRDSRASKVSRLHVFGDSHASACFDRFADADIYWLGPVTMHRVARDGADFVAQVTEANQSDLFVFVFGEIDVRCHVGRIADIQGVARATLVADLVSRFVERIRLSMSGRDGRVVICSVVPPSDFREDPNFPTYGTLDDRITITAMMNSSLRAAADEFGFIFLDFSRFYADRAGRLRMSRSDGAVHIGLDHTRQIRNELARVVGEPVRYRWDLWWRSWLHWPAERILSYTYPRAMWRFNRSHVNVRTRMKA